MLKKILLVIVALVVVVVVAAVALVLFVDVNRFKPQIESYVLDSYQRTLTIDGDLSLSVFPNIAISLPKMALSEPNAKPTTLSLTSAQVSVKLLPLLTGNVQADVISLNGLRADIVRRPDGTTNIDDLTGAGAGVQSTPADKPAETDSPATVSSSGLSEFNIGGIELSDAQVSFDDQQAKSKWVVANLNLKTGALTDGEMTPFVLSLDATGTNPKVQVNVSLDSELAIKLADQQLDATSLVLMIKGVFDGMPLEQKVQFEDLSVSAAQVAAGSVTTTSYLKQPERTTTVTIKTPLQMNLQDGTIVLASLQGQLDLIDKSLSAEPILIPIEGSIKANTKAETANVVLNLKAPDMALDARVDVKGFAQPAIVFDLKADRIDLDKFLPASEPVAEKAATPAAKKADAAVAQAEAPIDLSALKPLILDGKISIGELIASGAKVSKLAVTAKARKGILTLSPISAELYEGKLSGNASVNATGNKTGIKLDLTGIQIGPLLTDVADTSLLEGKGDVAMDVSTGGSTVTAMKQALNGQASMKLLDGAIKGINLGEKIREAKNLLKAGKAAAEPSNDAVRTDFSALTASFKIVNGIATNDDLAGKTPLLRLSGGGKVDIPASTLDYLAKATVVGTSKGQGGKDIQELNGVTIPVQLSGSFDQLAWEIDWKLAGQEMLKSRVASKLGVDKAKLDAKKAELKADARAREDELKEKAKDKLSEKLKKLF